MVNALIFTGMIVAVAVIIVILDWLGERKDRNSRHKAA
jgi:hypothetical protein